MFKDAFSARCEGALQRGGDSADVAIISPLNLMRYHAVCTAESNDVYFIFRFVAPSVYVDAGFLLCNKNIGGSFFFTA